VEHKRQGGGEQRKMKRDVTRDIRGIGKPKGWRKKASNFLTPKSRELMDNYIKYARSSVAGKRREGFFFFFFLISVVHPSFEESATERIRWVFFKCIFFFFFLREGFFGGGFFDGCGRRIR
jgi:hypothetical protein